MKTQSRKRHPIMPVVLTVMLLVSLLIGQIPVMARNESPSANSLESLCLNNGQAITSVHAATGKINFVGTEAGQAIPNPSALSADATAEQAARGYLSVCGSLFGIRDAQNELTLLRQKSTEIGGAAVRFQQTYQGIPVLGGEIIVTLDAQKNILSVGGETLPEIRVNPTPAIEATTAQQEALQAVAKYHEVNAEDLQVSEPSLWIYNPSLISPFSGESRLVWRMEVTPRELAPIRELVLIDAQRGSIALHFNQVDSALVRYTYTTNNTTTQIGRAHV